jgi:hypothetical protein
MIIEPIDFHSIFLDEGKGIYECLRRIDKDEFNHWAVLNFAKVGDVVNSFEDVKPNSSIINLSEHSGYKHRDIQCHYSAKAICILMTDFEYYTGFIKRNESNKPIITHSYNVYQNQIVDFTKYIADPLNRYESRTFPHEYFGVKIPREFVLNFRDETLNKFSMNPLICEWYCFSVGKIGGYNK